MRANIILPPYARGMRIGLFGGTFDPAHAAHRAACLLALRRLGLDRVWWLVTPGNPLKDTRGLAPLGERVAAARALAHHPRIDVSDVEAAAGHALHLRDDLLPGAAMPGSTLRLDHGRGQSAQLPSLAAMARHSGAGSDRGHRPARAEPLRAGERRRPGIGARPPPRIGGKDAAGTKAAGLDLPAWPQIAAVLDGIARGAGVARRLKPLTRHAYLSSSPGFDDRGDQERKDKDPCPHLPSLGPTVACPNRSPECVLTPRRSSTWSSRASTT